MRTRWVPLPRHAAQLDELMEVRWSDYYGAALFGDAGEIACLPHQGCWLEVITTAESSHREVNLVLPGQMIRYKRSFCVLDRVELPNATTVGLWHLVGFKLRLVSEAVTPVPSKDAGTNEYNLALGEGLAGRRGTFWLPWDRHRPDQHRERWRGAPGAHG